jgi:flagellar basal body-associated protein FliL
MSRGLQIALVASILVLAVAVAGLGAFLFLKSGAPSNGGEQAAETKAAKAAATEVVFFKTKNFVTDLADKDRLRYADVTLALAMKDEASLDIAKKAEPQIRDIVLGQLRIRVAADLAGSTGKEKLSEALQAALGELLKNSLVKVYVTDLIVQ